MLVCLSVCLFSLTLVNSISVSQCSWKDLNHLSGLLLTLSGSQRKERNDRRNYFRINLHETYLTGLGLEFTTPGLAMRFADYAVRPAAICATKHGKAYI